MCGVNFIPFTGFHLMEICKSGRTTMVYRPSCVHTANNSALEHITTILQLLSSCPYGRAGMGSVICNEDLSGLGIYSASMSSRYPVQWGRKDNSNWLTWLAEVSVCKSGHFRIPPREQHFSSRAYQTTWWCLQTLSLKGSHIVVNLLFES